MKNLLRFSAFFALAHFYVLSVTAQAPNLGTAANFELFTTVGAITNTGISRVTGDVGSNNGAVSGFGNVNGVMQTPSNGATAQAMTDLNTALGLINSAAPSSPLAPALGGGDTLIAGVYDVSGVSSLNGELILDAQNNSSAVFIFRLSQAFSSGVGAKVRLINGAQACNVFWRANGMIDLGDETFMRGNLIANNDAFALGVHDTLEGRAFAINGAITLNGVMAYRPTGCNVPLPTGPARPVSGAALSCFAIFSGDGDITDTNNSIVTGDIGTNLGSAGGYNPLNVSGMIHPQPDNATIAAAGDLTTLYNGLNLMTADIRLLYPAQFGNDLVLTPHTYLMTAGASLTGNLYLDAQGVSNAVFVIRINGALTAASLSHVHLVNGTQAKNVFWLIKGAATFGTLAVFNGDIISTGAISTATTDTINGKLFTTVGAITTQASLITANTEGCLGLLAVNWLSFRAVPVKADVQLTWETANEVNADFFTLEKSRDGISFQPIATVNAAGLGNYSFIDRQPYSLGYYRISETDNVGRRNYYRTIQVKMNAGTVPAIYAYTTGSNLYTQASGMQDGPGNLTIYNAAGKVISTQAVNIQSGQNTFSTAKPVQKGVYVIKLVSASQAPTVVRIIVL